MSHEREPSHCLRASEVFGLAEQEQRDYCLSDHRLQQLLDDPTTTIHAVRLEGNREGEFLFVTLSKATQDGKRAAMTCYGLGGFHSRERCYTQDWYWYENHPIDTLFRRVLPKEAAQQFIQARREEISPYLTETVPVDPASLQTFLALFPDEAAVWAALSEFDQWVEQIDREE